MTKQVMTNNVINFKDKNFDLEHEAFWVQDVYGYIHDIFDEVTYCDQLYIPKEDRRKGIASKLLQDFIKENIDDNKLYFVQAGFSTLEYTEEEFENATEEERNELFYNLNKFYTKNGFFNINDFIGSYENKVMYLYTNEAAIKLVEKIIELNTIYDIHILDNSRFTANTKQKIIVNNKYGDIGLFKTIMKYNKNNELCEYIDAAEDEINKICAIVSNGEFVRIVAGIGIKIRMYKTVGRISIIRIRDDIINRKSYFMQIK